MARRIIKGKLELWKEMLPSIGKSELLRLISRLKRHATIVSWKTEDYGFSIIVRYNSIRDRISSRVLLSSWIGRRNYQSLKMNEFKGAIRKRKL